MKHVDWAELKKDSIDLPAWEVDRLPAALQVRLEVSPHDAIEGLLKDISSTGFMCECSLPLLPGSTVAVDLPALGWKQAKVVWQTGRRLGARFDEEISRLAFEKLASSLGGGDVR